jgi:hypothetical protein
VFRLTVARSFHEVSALTRQPFPKPGRFALPKLTRLPLRRFAEPGTKHHKFFLSSNAFLSRAGHGQNREAPPSGHGVGSKKLLCF